MKTAISVPDETFRAADRAAEQLGWSRSQLYSRAVQEFLEGQGEDPVTVALNELADEMNAQTTPSTAHSLIESGMWEW
jgi:ABC-type transporter Mla subunit MlaD